MKKAGLVHGVFAFVDSGKLVSKPTSGSGILRSGVELANVGMARTDPAASQSRVQFAPYVRKPIGNVACGLEDVRQ